MATESDGKRIILTEEQAALLHRAALAYARSLRDIYRELTWQWTEAERGGLQRQEEAISDLVLLLAAEDEDYEFHRITLEWSDAPFPDVALRSEEGE